MLVSSPYSLPEEAVTLVAAFIFLYLLILNLSLSFSWGFGVLGFWGFDVTPIRVLLCIWYVNRCLDRKSVV